MRIISGDFKGKLIKFLKTNSTRPLRDSVKENIFNILKHNREVNVSIEESDVLDLYSGVGSFGLECISRNAQSVTFIEKDKIIIEYLKKNISNLGINNKCNIVNDKIELFLNKNFSQKYNIFFLDPPFKEKFFIQNLISIKKKKIYYKNHIIIIHREGNSKDNFNNIFNVISEKNYGRSKIIFGKFN